MKEYFPKEIATDVKMIGFIGIDSYDYLLYLARILVNLEFKVLVIDYSEQSALSEALYDLKEIKENIKEPCILNHQGIDYIPQVDGWGCRGEFYHPYLYHLNSDYDVILTDYGISTTYPALMKSDQVILVTDMQKHNLRMIQAALDDLEVPKEVIVENIVPGKIKAKDLFMNQVRGNQNKIHYLNLDVNDLANRIQLQHTRTINLKKCSKEMKMLLVEVVKKIVADKSEKEIFRALSVTLRGK